MTGTLAMQKPKGIGLLSGGLDSILAFWVLREQNVDLLGLIFKTPFFGPVENRDYERIIDAPVEVVDITESHMEMLRNPVYGFGSQMNPCIDCHALMLREAGRKMQDPARDFLFTGEVLGQRPMSQRRDSLKSVEKLSGYPGRVLRPLSARLLPPTTMEVEALIDRSKLLDIQGRSRKRQETLARQYGITDYAQPGGGCMLTKEGFAHRLRRLFELYPRVSGHQVELLKWGRTFALSSGKICVIGRDQHDNAKLEAMAGREEMVFRMQDHPGPTGVLIGMAEDSVSLTATARILAAYSDAAAGVEVAVSWQSANGTGVLRVDTVGKDAFRPLLIG